MRVLAMLAAARPRIVATDALLHAMYWDDPGGGALSAEKRLHLVILALRRRLPPGAITNHYGVGYALARGVDVRGLLPVDALKGMPA